LPVNFCFPAPLEFIFRNSPFASLRCTATRH
jgi:hypothetical protein